MGTQNIGMTATMPQGRRTSFRRVFVWYCAGILGATFAVSCILEWLLFVWYLNARRTTSAASEPSLTVRVELIALAVPFVVLVAAILFFAWRMGRKVSRPVDELLRAVEKIRQRDLDFAITYHERNELGDLCGALDDLRHELRDSLEREWQKQEGMRTMVAALSHDLRTPVTIIQGHVEGLARAEAGEKRTQRLERYLPVLEANSQRMSRLLNDMLLVSALEQTSFGIQPRLVALEEEMARRAEVYALQAAASNITFVYEFGNLAAEASPVMLDLHRIEQVLDNLFENAVRYTPTHGHICLTCTRMPREIILTLRDSGPGVAPGDLPHIWERFYRGQPAPSTNDGKPNKTTGLGLYICKLLVDRHGGTITLRNHPAGGCEVTVRLPAAADVLVNPVTPPQYPTPAPGPRASMP